MDPLGDLVPMAPVDRIAAAPIAPRDHAKLLVCHRSGGALIDRHVADLPTLLERGDVLVINDTKVLPARVRATRRRTGGKALILFLPADAAPPGHVHALVETRGSPRAGEILETAGGDLALAGDLIEGRCLLDLTGLAPTTLGEFLERHGETPLPGYIQRARRERGLEDLNEESVRYQTVFADRPGAVAAPTAGLHFTPELLDALGNCGIEILRITLHVGPGTFMPIRSADPRLHPMAPESAAIDESTAAALECARLERRRIIAVGTTAVRTLESIAAANQGRIVAGAFAANIFIYPPFAFRVIGGLMTNFHLPDSTPCLLVAALLGIAPMRRAYEHALAGDYRFYSYGDAMLILP